MAKEEQSRLAAAVSKARGDIRSEDDMRNSINFLNDAANRIKEQTTHNTRDSKHEQWLEKELRDMNFPCGSSQ